MQETLDKPVATPETSAERQAVFVDRDPNKTYFLGCGDDRQPTEESAKKVAAKLNVEKDAFLRYYGGLYGATRVLGVTIAAQYGSDALAKYGDSFADLAVETKGRIERTSKVKTGAHSAESNEDSSSELNLDSEKGLGCAYCQSLGAVCGLCQPAGGLVDLAREEQTALFGDDSLVDVTTSANAAFEQQFFPEEKTDYSVTRSDMQSGDVSVSILAGSHKKAAKVTVVENFHIDKVSDPSKANKTGVPFYNNDVTAVAEMLIKAYPELNLNPRIMFAVMDHDIRAVRAALASGENLGAEAMVLERYGDPNQAIAYLESLQA